MCCDYQVKLIRPPFLRDEVQFSADNATENADIASARVYLERPNQRLKVFQILGSKMSSCLIQRYSSKDAYTIKSVDFMVKMAIPS